MLLAKPSNSTIFPMISLLARHSLQWRRIEFHIPEAWYPIFTPLTDSDIILAGGATELASTKAPLNLPLLISASLHRDDHVVLAQQPVGLDLTLTLLMHFIALPFPNVTCHLQKS